MHKIRGFNAAHVERRREGIPFHSIPSATSFKTAEVCRATVACKRTFKFQFVAFYTGKMMNKKTEQGGKPRSVLYLYLIYYASAAVMVSGRLIFTVARYLMISLRVMMPMNISRSSTTGTKFWL